MKQSMKTIIENSGAVFVNSSCRKSYTGKRKIKETTMKKQTRSSTTGFKNDTNCLFCNEVCSLDERHPVRKTWVLTKTSKLKENTLNMFDKRLKRNAEDEWALTVQARCNASFDFVAMKVRYHKVCRVWFEGSQHSNKKRKAKKQKDARLPNE